MNNIQDSSKPMVLMLMEVVFQKLLNITKAFLSKTLNMDQSYV